MKKILIFIAVTLNPFTLFAGGLVTNTNQSAAWIRLPARNASVDIDAVYFNPGGLMKLNNGFHFSISNQTIFQTKEIENFYKGPGGTFGLNQNLYKGEISAPVFPSVHAVYKMERFAISFGFYPVGGGGGATYKNGLPSFEMSPSDLVPALAASQGATGYKLDAYLKGTSIFLGFQGGASFKVNDLISVAVGLRYINAKNTYKGHLKDIEVNLPSGWARADLIMTSFATGATSAATSTTALVTGGVGGLTLAEAEAATIINTEQRLQLESALTAFGSPATVSISQADAVFKSAAARYDATATLLHDQEADVVQTGSGFTPFFSVNISPTENLNIGIKYEMATKLELQNKTTKDFTTGFTSTGTPITLFPNKEIIRNDMPAMVAVGLDYKLSSNAKISLGSDYFFDKTANYGHTIDSDLNPSTPSTDVSNKDIIDHNGWSLQAGLEVNLSEKLLVSGGCVFANKGVNSNYQSDLTFGLATRTFGAGGAFKVWDNHLLINFGVSYTQYKKDENLMDHVFSATDMIYQVRQTYNAKTMLFGVGLDFNF